MSATTSRVRLWTDEEIGFLEDNWHLTAREAGRALDRGMQSVQHKRNEMRRGGVRLADPWHEDEVALVRTTPGLTSAQVATLLPGRSAFGVNYIRSLLARSEGKSFGQGEHKSPHHIGRRRLLAKTCLTCGLFLDAEWFRRNSNGNLRTGCAKCISTKTIERQRGRESTSARDGGESSRRIARKLQNLSLPRAVNKGKEWTEADMPILSDPDLTAIEKALRLGRTYFAIHGACKAYGFTSKVGRGDPLKGQWLIQFPTIEETAA